MINHTPYIRDGNNKSVAVLMIHGIAGSPAHFRDLIGTIPEDVTLYNILLDGHGKDVSDFGKSSMKKWKAQISSVVNSLLKSHEKLFIVAHSMGTLFAIQEAISNKDRIAGLFLLSVPTRPWVRFSTVITSLRAVFGKQGKDVTRLLNDTSITLDKRLWKYIPWIPRYAELLREICRTRKLLPKLCVPTLVFHSKTDELVSFRSAKDFADYPYIQTTVLYGSGHFAYDADDTVLLQRELSKTIRNLNGQAK